MSDLIERDAAIKSVRKAYIPEDNAYEHWFNMGVKAAITQINRTDPSTKPEIIRCRDCKHWDKTWTNDWSPDYHYCPMIDGVRKGDFYCADAEWRADE